MDSSNGDSNCSDTVTVNNLKNQHCHASLCAADG